MKWRYLLIIRGTVSSLPVRVRVEDGKHLCNTIPDGVTLNHAPVMKQNIKFAAGR